MVIKWNQKTEYSEKHYRWLVKEKLGIPLKKGWIVHHIDGNKGNDDINNLALCFSKKAHFNIHKEWKQAWHLQTHEATELGRFFKFFAKNYRRRKVFEDDSYHFVRNTWMEVLIKLKPIELWPEKDRKLFLYSCMTRKKAREYIGDKLLKQ